MKSFIPTLAAVLLASCAASQTIITVDTQSPGHRISPEVFGNNVGWMTFNNFYKEKESLPDALFQDIIELGVPSLRYPGGCWSDNFMWEQTIGPREKRIDQFSNGCRPPAYKVGVAYFGVDEYLRLCEKIGAEPQITLQFRPLDTLIRLEPERGYLTLSDPGPEKIAVADGKKDSQKHVLLPAKDASIQMDFHCPRDGYYRLRLFIDAGKDGKLLSAYKVTLDKEVVTLKLRNSALVDDGDAKVFWGVAESDVLWMVWGKRELVLIASEPGIRIDTAHVVELNHDNSVKRAAAWVAYCNGDTEDNRPIGIDQAGIDWKTVGYWAALRGSKEYGNHPEPYGVKYWEVGNEAWGVDPYGSPAGFNAHAYSEGWKNYNSAMSAIDPSLKISICSNTPDSQGGPVQWSAVSIRRLGQLATYLHYHPYYPFDRWNKDELKLYKGGVTAFTGVSNSLNIYRDIIRKYHPNREGHLLLSASEWAAAYGWSGPPQQGWATRWTGAMAVADILGVFSNNADMLHSGQYWLLWSGDVCVFEVAKGANAPHGYIKHGLYDVIRMYNRYWGNRVLPVRVEGAPVYDFHGWGTMMPKGDYPMITAYASQDERARYLLIINKDWEKPQTVTVNWKGLADGQQVTKVEILAGEKLPNYADLNTGETQVIQTREHPAVSMKSTDSITLPPTSLTMLVVARPDPSPRLIRLEAENYFTIRKDVGGKGAPVADRKGKTPAQTFVELPDKGDSIVMPVRIMRDGIYRLTVRLGADNAAIGYVMTLNGQAIKTSFSRPKAGDKWVDAIIEPQRMKVGRHYLVITAAHPGGRFDRLDIEEMP